MRVGKCVPMIALCLLLGGCGESTEPRDPREAHQAMSGCEMTAAVTCDQAGLEWSATLRCAYVPGGESVVEVIGPLELAGVRAVIRETDWSLEYGDLHLNAGPLSREALTPAVTPVRMMSALREGWLLEENQEVWGGEDCVRLALEQTGAEGGSIVTTLWLRQEDDTPVYGEIAVDGEMILSAEFTDFTFCAMIDEKADEGTPP